LVVGLLSAVLGALVPDALAAPKFQVLHAFGNGDDGAGTWGSLLLDKAGNLYGTTGGGGGTGCGGEGCGTVFELTPSGNGTWREQIIYRFNDTPDSNGPLGSVIFDAEGNLYGPTVYGGTYGYGTVFELTPGSGGWTEKVLLSFDITDGCCPRGGVAVGKGGAVYGAGGVVFKLTEESNRWTEHVLHRFGATDGDGSDPLAVPIFDEHGNLFGTTAYGGKRCGGTDCGTVYELSPAAGGRWRERILYRFNNNGRDGRNPGGGSLTMDAEGKLYGTTVAGGRYAGVIFELAPQETGAWKETILYEFQGGSLGFEPGGGVVRNKAGNLYGTTVYGGSPQCDCGVVYKLAPQKNGKWKYTALHTFVGTDGAQPDANLILDSKGNLYGTAATGGQYGAGVVFEVTP